jgi:hypothetical protein
MNGVPDDLPDALQDRLPVDIEITDLAQGAVDRLPEDLREACRNTALAKSEERNISIRMWMEFASLRDHLKDEEGGTKTAAYAVFGNKADAALTALTLGASASPAIDAEGNELNETTLIKMRTVFDWIDNYISAQGIASTSLLSAGALATINNELAQVALRHAEQTDERVFWSTTEDIVQDDIFVHLNGVKYTRETFKAPV